MQSVCRRRKESSAARRIYDFESPFRSGPISSPTLVAMRTFLRLPLAFSHLPSTVSDSPPLFPGIHAEYTSAVSMKLHPAATNASNSRKDVGSSAVHPKTYPPKASRATSSPEFPNFRFFMDRFPPGHDY